MRAVQLTRIGLLELVDIPEPVAGPDEVMIEVEFAGVCGSDVHGVHGGFLRVPPVVMGHEFVGRTSDGTLFAVNPTLSCGVCARCAGGHDHLCPSRAFVGMHRQGGFAERVVVPRSCLVVVPPGIDGERAVLTEPLAVSLHAWRLAAPVSGDRVAVIGAGTIGVGVLAIAKQALGESATVVVAERDAARAARAQRMGAVTVETLVGEFDVVIDAVGSSESHSASISTLRPGGTTVWVGNVSDEAGFDARLFVRSELTILGSTAYSSRDFEDAAAMVDLMPDDAVDVQPLDRGLEVFRRFEAGELPALKTVLSPRY